MTVVDISSPSSPYIVGFISSSTQLDGVRAPASHARVATRLLPLMPCTVCLCTCTQPRSVAVRGNYALVASSEGASLTVVDISSPSSPVIVGFISSSTQLDKVRARHPTHVQPLVPVWPRPDHRASAHACRPKESLWPEIMQSSSVVALNP